MGNLKEKKNKSVRRNDSFPSYRRIHTQIVEHLDSRRLK